MMIGQEDLMRMNLARKRLQRKGGRGWAILELAFNLWQAAVVALCLGIVIFG